MSFILHTVILAYDIDLRVGHANVVVPDVITGENFSLVCKQALRRLFYRK